MSAEHTLVRKIAIGSTSIFPSILLPDHLGFLNELDAIIGIADGPQLGIALISLDCVSRIDGLLGYRDGDLFCVEVAHLLGQALKEGDRVFRVGRNELVCLLRRVPSETHAVLAAYKILRTLNTSLSVDGRYFDASPFVGIAIVAKENKDANEILRQANIAMHEARQKKNRFAIYDGKLDALRLNQFQMQSDLRVAITNNELEVCFQPKVDLRSGRVAGVESLVRWRHPTKGDIPPEDFVPLAEASGFISELTMRVLHLSLSHYEAMRAVSDHLHIAVNLSPTDFRESDLSEVIRQVLNVWNIPAESLTLELTETTVMEDDGMYDETFESLKQLGVQLSIDDFGTGYSSMSRLRNLPMNELKIDMSFVRHMLTYASDEWIVLSMIKLAHDLGLTVVAEGVEDMQTLRRLRDLGCDLVQGYFISKPLNAEDTLVFLANWKGFPE